MKKSILKVHPADNIIVALRDLSKGEEVKMDGHTYTVSEDIPAKHKFTETNLEPGDTLTMYGVLVVKAQSPIHAGAKLSTSNVNHS